MNRSMVSLERLSGDVVNSEWHRRLGGVVWFLCDRLGGGRLFGIGLSRWNQSGSSITVSRLRLRVRLALETP